MAFDVRISARSASLRPTSADCEVRVRLTPEMTPAAASARSTGGEGPVEPDATEEVDDRAGGGIAGAALGTGGVRLEPASTPADPFAISSSIGTSLRR